jgi:hypothetical protein
MILPPVNYLSWTRPDSQATLDLKFSIWKELGGLVTFARASSSGMYFDENGVGQFAASGEPVFDHDPLTGESLGLRVEAAGTNLILSSEDFTTVVWTNSSGVPITPAAAISPDGSLSASEITFSASKGSIFQRTAFPSATVGDFSLFVKSAATGSATHIRATTTNADAFNTGISQKVELTSDWQRLELSGLLRDGGTACDVNLGAIAADGSLDPDCYGSVLIWGAQLETGSRASSYIPTAGSQVTRLADSAQITGSAFSDFYNQDEGTFVVEGIGDQVAGGFPVIAEVSDGTTNNLIEIYRGSSLESGFIVLDGGATQANITAANGFPDGTVGKVAASYKANDFAQSSNGQAATADSSGSVPSGIDRLIIGAPITGNASNYWNGTIARITYYPRRLSNATLQRLSQ